MAVYNATSATQTLVGDSGADTFIIGSGTTQAGDIFNGSGGIDTLKVGASFTSASDGQIVKIENVVLTAAGLTLDLSNQTEVFTITGSSGVDIITGGSGADRISAGAGNDTIIGAQNDALLNGGAGTDTLKVGASFTSTSNGQIVNIEEVLLTAADLTLNLSKQAEGFSITGSSGADTITGGAGKDTITGAAGADSITGGAGADSISAGAGNDTINGAQNDVLLDGGDDTDTLNVGASFTSTSDGQIANIENVELTKGGLILNLSKQTEAFSITALSGVNIITGGSGADTITGGSGADRISAGAGNDTIIGAQNDTLLNGGADTDTLNVGASFTSTSNGQIVNIEEVLLTAADLTLNLSKQTEGFTITGSSGADIIIGGGKDVFIGRGGADKITLSGTSSKIKYTSVSDTGANTTSGSSLSTSAFDVIYGHAIGNTIDITGPVGSTPTIDNAVVTVAGVSDYLVFARGTYDATAATFTYAVAGLDSLMTWDLTSGGSNSFQSIVLVGFVNGTATLNTDSISGLLGFA